MIPKIGVLKKMPKEDMILYIMKLRENINKRNKNIDERLFLIRDTFKKFSEEGWKIK